MKIDAALATRLAPWGFDNSQLDGFIGRLAQAATSNAVTGKLTPPAPEDVRALPTPGSEEHRRLVKRGKDALAEKKVGVVILAGGMATRFGGVVKAWCRCSTTAPSSSSCSTTGGSRASTCPCTC